MGSVDHYWAFDVEDQLSDEWPLAITVTIVRQRPEAHAKTRQRDEE
jgi:hypothetical protein